MVETFSIGGETSGADALYAAKAVAQTASSATATQVQTDAARPLSPSIYLDSTTGVLVTEYYSTDGQLENQIPSEAVMAYLRTGLAASGEPQTDAAAQPDATAIAAQPSVVAQVQAAASGAEASAPSTMGMNA